MQDLTGFTPRERPRPVVAEGVSVIVEPYDGERHAAELWQGLGGTADAINDLLKYFPNALFTGPADFRAWLDRENASGSYVTRVFRSRESGRLVGTASYMRLDEKNGVIEVGSVAHGPAMQRSTMATEAHYMMARHIFDDLGYRRYEWKLNNENEKSHSSARRLGFTYEGVFRNHMVAKGRNRDTAWYAMIDSEWPELKAAFEAFLAPENFTAGGMQVRSLAEIREDRANG
ncbi:GNAT family N-acetyltransferase [Martelella soudanensis]|uniref:GNAT family N-acetyltransferase n=1 Tax=unclassified Martelella TaxID=2629616 RepID=UPI0015DED2F5|nr:MULTISPECIES: GNAT family protein [unclassified Martelella]